jgi:hypothetical protein
MEPPPSPLGEQRLSLPITQLLRRQLEANLNPRLPKVDSEPLKRKSQIEVAVNLY